MRTAVGSLIGAAAINVMQDMELLSLMEPIPTAGPSPIHRRGKHKPNARAQKGRKTLPRKP